MGKYVKLGGKHLWYIIPLVSVAILFFFDWEENRLDVSLFFRKFWVNCFITATIWLVDAYFFDKMVRLYPDFKDTFKRVLITVPGFVICTFIVYSIDCLILCKLIFNLPVYAKFLENVRIVYVVTALVYVIYECIYFYNNWKRTFIYAEQLQKEHTKAQYESLKSQINPHFLFNSLNTLSAIIPQDADKAVDFVHKLSNTYRYLLKMKERELVPLNDELEFAKAYIFLIKSRYGDNIQIHMEDQQTARGLLLPPVSLQMLLENCIKHNVISRDKPLKIDIVVKNSSITIINNLQPKQMSEPSTGFGLDNIKKRYEVLSDKTMSVVQTAYSFEVTLPLLNLEP